MESEHYSLSMSINRQPNKPLLAFEIVVLVLILIGLLFVIYRLVNSSNNNFTYSHYQPNNSSSFNPVKLNLTEPEESFWNPQ